MARQIYHLLTSSGEWIGENDYDGTQGTYNPADDREAARESKLPKLWYQTNKGDWVLAKTWKAGHGRSRGGVIVGYKVWPRKPAKVKR